MAFKPRDELLHDELDVTWIELLLPKPKPILCGVVYRHFQQCNFYECAYRILTSMKRNVIHGDFSTDVSKTRRCNLIKSLFGFMDLFKFSQIISDVDFFYSY